MQHSKEMPHIEDWLKKADKDLQRVQARLKDGDTEDAAFHLQQGLEKYLKAYLLSKGWRLKKIHDLEMLLDEAAMYLPEIERFRELCEEATGYYLVERYPSISETPDSKAVIDGLSGAKDMVKMLRGNLDN
ncbi:MAG: HEPN domain-containing protein [Deltaproteobacteria bacterium]|jgi:HEPN domain-containing protein